MQALKITPFTPTFPRAMAIIYEEPKGGTLWLGSMRAAQDINLLEEFGIATVIAISKGVKLSYPETINYQVIEIGDQNDYPIQKHFNQTYTEILGALHKGSVLVYCQTGIQRSPTIVMAFMMKRMGWKFEETNKYILERRPYTSISKNFLEQLRRYESVILPQKRRVKSLYSEPTASTFVEHSELSESVSSFHDATSFLSQSTKLTPIKTVDEARQSRYKHIRHFDLDPVSKILEEESPTKEKPDAYFPRQR